MSEGGFFSFKTLVSALFIKTFYVLGLLLITGVAIYMMVAGTMAAMQPPPAAPVAAQPAGRTALPSLFEAQTEQMLFQQKKDQAIQRAVIGFVLLIGGNLLWCFLCEAWILFFSMHELLASIDKSLRQVEPNTYKRMVT